LQQQTQEFLKFSLCRGARKQTLEFVDRFSLDLCLI
ncbi:hypothetical protein CP082626L3_0958C, partial [Chlamydia psittaci 08-2626_L3]